MHKNLKNAIKNWNSGKSYYIIYVNQLNIGLWHFGTTTYNVLIWISYVSLLLDYSNIWFALNILVNHTNSIEGVKLNDQHIRVI